MSRSVSAVVVIATLLAACAWTRDPARAVWTVEWNERIESAKTPFQHPCATRPFIAWADGFLIGCERDAKLVAADCDARTDWVEARVAQCREWTAWQLRNFNQHERTEGMPPSMRIE